MNGDVRNVLLGRLRSVGVHVETNRLGHVYEDACDAATVFLGDLYEFLARLLGRAAVIYYDREPVLKQPIALLKTLGRGLEHILTDHGIVRQCLRAVGGLRASRRPDHEHEVAPTRQLRRIPRHNVLLD